MTIDDDLDEPETLPEEIVHWQPTHRPLTTAHGAVAQAAVVALDSSCGIPLLSAKPPDLRPQLKTCDLNISLVSPPSRSVFRSFNQGKRLQLPASCYRLPDSIRLSFPAPVGHCIAAATVG